MIVLGRIGQSKPILWRLNLLIIFVIGGGMASAEKSGDIPDGSQGQYVHVLGLYPADQEGNQGHKITAQDAQPQPVSLRHTCGRCHDVDKISQGHHFNATDPNIYPGRPGEPWIYADPRLAVQIPLSYRLWPQTWRPEAIGLDTSSFTKQFGRHDPYLSEKDEGGGIANCLICHLRDTTLNPGGVGGVADMTRQGRPDLVATVLCPQTRVDLNTQQVHMDAQIFDDNNDVVLDLTKDVPNQRCLYCHSQTPVLSPPKSQHMQDDDVHMSAGMQCVDCHRHGLDHQMNRGYEQSTLDPNRAWTRELTCEGCHVVGDHTTTPMAGRLGAPIAKHRGIPAVHFKTLTCTACHTGPWPEEHAGYNKSSRAHALGTTYAEKAGEALPRIQYPVYTRQPDGRIAPMKMMWPAFWAELKGEDVTPLSLDQYSSILKRIIRRSHVPKSQGWPNLTDDQLIKALTRLQALESVKGTAVYVCGGRLWQLNEAGALVSEEHSVAQPCVWPSGHPVRPAAQSLGVRYCRDCHDQNSPFFFGETFVDSPLVVDQDRRVSMVDWQLGDPQLQRLFGWTFIFRPWLKLALLGAAAVIGLVLVVFGVRGTGWFLKNLSGGCK